MFGLSWCNLFLLITAILCTAVFEGDSFLHSRRTTPKPRDASCTNDIIGNLTCYFRWNGDCGYTSHPVGTKGLRWRINTWRGVTSMDITGGSNHDIPNGSKGGLVSPTIDDDSVEAVCIEIKVETAVGHPGVRIANRLANGSVVGMHYFYRYPSKGQVLRIHGCVAAQSSIYVEAIKRDEYTYLSLSYIRVSNSTMNCTKYREDHFNSTLTTAIPSVTAPFPTVPGEVTDTRTTTSETGRGIPDVIEQTLSCDFQKDLCHYASRAGNTGGLEWRRDWFYHGIAARLFDRTLNAPLGSEARLRGAFPDYNTTSVHIEFSYWGQDHSSLISVYNEQSDGVDIRIGKVIADSPCKKKVARFNACVTKNSYISIAAQKTSKDGLWVWVDDLKVTTSNQPCPGSSSSPLPTTTTVL